MGQPDFRDILEFWFGPTDSPDYGQPQDFWFVKDAAFDLEVTTRFLAVYQQAARHELMAWENTPLSSLALAIVLDQFPRNLFRNTPQAFATDPLALAVARNAIAQGFDTQVLPVQRWFFYLPFEHSEMLTDQEMSLQLWAQLRGDPNSENPIHYAYRHWEVIARFGRFPHRNPILGRPSTPEELGFLQEPGSHF
ncbi:DUF924 family protein [Synechococcus sp. PCC 6312]|uniref:DUF924 family protein n=1 Tax=Synechococcus sp. (strain ATCC 27167 / PCC 6312) TaxID=195253 RepID=UPI00029ED8A8|nr:DUF924 family protein [Synechococcus sp. PCC 6312]AFY62347.1 hypothetical protein Syn6312_3305 [Synechococcus sp. PCC 6312]